MPPRRYLLTAQTFSSDPMRNLKLWCVFLKNGQSEIQMYKLTERQKDRHTERQTDRDTMKEQANK